MSKEDKSFVASWLSECTKAKALLILTPTGSGISTWLTKTAIPQHGFEEVQINQHTAKIKSQIQDAARSTVTPLGKRKILVLDGFDVLVNDSIMLGEASSTLSEPVMPVVCIAHVSRTVEKKFNNVFKSWTTHIIHIMPKVEDIVECLVAKSNGPKCDLERANNLAIECRGDTRQAMLRSEYKEFHAKDEFYEAEQVLSMLRKKTYTLANDIYRAARGDRQVLSLSIFETYDPLQSIECSDMYSLLDTMPRNVQECDWYDYLMVTYPAMHYKERTSKLTKFTYGMIWSKSHLLANRIKQAKQASVQFFHKGMRSVYHCILDEYPFYRSMMQSYVESNNNPPSPPPWVDRGTDVKAILKVMRLWKTPWYNHAKVMKWMLQSWSTNESIE